MSTSRNIHARHPPPKPTLHSTHGSMNSKAVETRKRKYQMDSFWWRRHIWIESTFALTLYEPWEKYLVLSIFSVLCAAMLVVVLKDLPHQLIVMRRRSIYHIWGEHADGSEAALWQYLGLARAH